MTFRKTAFVFTDSDESVNTRSNINEDIDIEVVAYLHQWDINELTDCLDRFPNIIIAEFRLISANNPVMAELVTYLTDRGITIVQDGFCVSVAPRHNSHAEYIHDKVLHLRTSTITTFITTFLG